MGRTSGGIGKILDLQLTKWDLENEFLLDEVKASREGKDRYQAELETLLAVSTVPPSTTNFMPSTTEEPAVPPTKG